MTEVKCEYKAVNLFHRYYIYYLFLKFEFEIYLKK